MSVSILSGMAFCWSGVLGWRLAQMQDSHIRTRRESRAGIVFVLGVVFLLIAIALWIGYLILGPMRDAASELLQED